MLSHNEEDFDNPADDVMGAFKTALLCALGAVALAAAAGIYLSDSEGAAVTAGMVAEAKGRACISQFGPGERWRTPSSFPRSLPCAGAAVEVPAHILSMPVTK